MAFLFFDDGDDEDVDDDGFGRRFVESVSV